MINLPIKNRYTYACNVDGERYHGDIYVPINEHPTDDMVTKEINATDIEFYSHVNNMTFLAKFDNVVWFLVRNEVYKAVIDEHTVYTYDGHPTNSVWECYLTAWPVKYRILTHAPNATRTTMQYPNGNILTIVMDEQYDKYDSMLFLFSRKDGYNIAYTVKYDDIKAEQDRIARL